jgi:hypothetical protein
VTNRTFFPIPGNVGGSDNLCSKAGGSDANGCILVVEGSQDKKHVEDHHDENDCVASGSPVIDAHGGHDSDLMRGRCDHDRR